MALLEPIALLGATSHRRQYGINADTVSMPAGVVLRMRPEALTSALSCNPRPCCLARSVRVQDRPKTDIKINKVTIHANPIAG